MESREHHEAKTLSVPEAGRRYFGLGLGVGGSYAAAHRGEIPVIKLGHKLRVPHAARGETEGITKPPRCEGAAVEFQAGRSS
jgi:hypothetical protein